MTTWYYEDDVCWIAECESCSVPMVVWREHSATPPDLIKAHLHQQLAAVVAAHFDFVHFVDDNLRTIPDHYHAHARPRGRLFGRPLKS
jgi:hypothetical protein